VYVIPLTFILFNWQRVKPRDINYDIGLV